MSIPPDCECSLGAAVPADVSDSAREMMLMPQIANAWIEPVGDAGDLFFARFHFYDVYWSWHILVTMGAGCDVWTKPFLIARYLRSVRSSRCRKRIRS